MPTVRALLDVLTPAVRAAGATTGAAYDVEVTEVVLVGPDDAAPDLPGAVLVCTSGVPEGARAAAVVVKGEPPSSHVPVLLAEAGLPWNHLLHLLVAAVSATGSTDAVGDLFALANSVAAAVGGAVAVEDPQRRVLAYSSLGHAVDEARREGILGRVVPHYSRNDEVYREVARAAGVVRVPAEGDVLPRLAVAVRSGAEVLGSLWVVEGSPLDDAAEQALLDAAPLAALHLLRARGGAQHERRARGEILRGLLDGRAAPELAGTRLGVEPDAPVTVMAFGLPASTADSELDADAVADLVQLQCAAVRPRSSVLVQLGTAYVLVPGAVSRERLAELAERVVERAAVALRIELSAAVGGTVATLHDLAHSRHDADVLLRLLGPGRTARVEDLPAQIVLHELAGHLAASPRLRLPEVDAMLASDADHGTPYAETVLAYLAADSDVPSAAAAIRVHPNTFRYRLRRVRELFALDLDDPDTRLVAWLLLRTGR